MSAIGSVQLFYQGRVLQADRVVYNRATKRVYAEGHAKMTDEHGDVVYGSRFELSENFRDGFIDSVQVLTSDKTRFTSPRVERTNGEVTVWTKGPTRPANPARIIPSGRRSGRCARRRSSRTRRPTRSTTRTRRCWSGAFLSSTCRIFLRRIRPSTSRPGFLAPSLISGGNLGYGLSMPYFINLAPSYDLTLTPSYPLEAGLLGRGRLAPAAVKRHYNIRATGIDEQQPNRSRRILMARETCGCAARSRPTATFFSTTCGSLAGTGHGCRTSSSLTTTGFRASTSATTISRTSSRRSICAARPIAASSTSAPTISKARRRTTTTARCRWPLRRSSTTTGYSTYPPTAPTGSAAK